MADAPHLYAVGDAVMCELLHGLNGSAACSIVKQLPPLGTQLQYRIKYNDEKFERVVLEGQLTPMAVAAERSVRPPGRFREPADVRRRRSVSPRRQLRLLHWI